MFNITTAKISRRRLDGSNYHVWADAHGNMQLCCISRHEKGSALVTKATIDAFEKLSCEGTKTVRFANPTSSMDVVVAIDELTTLDLIESEFGKPYYLVGTDTFADGADIYPKNCDVL